MSILDYIGKGRENAVTRSQLVSRTGLPDRKVREMIEQARREGAPILNLQDGRGYYLSDELEDLRRQYKSNHRRAMSVLVQQKFLRRRIKELEAKHEKEATNPDGAGDAEQ